MKRFAIIVFFIPLLAYSAYLAAAHGPQVDVLRLGTLAQSVILFLLVLPTIAWRHFDVFSVRHTEGHAKEPHLME